MADHPTPTAWYLPAEKINSLQQESLLDLVRLCKGAHFTNVRIRINGEWREVEADWIKHLQPVEQGEG